MSATAAVARRSLRQVWIGASVWALAFGATILATSLAYVSTFPTQAQRAQVAAATKGQVGLTVLFGSVTRIDTVGGYTEYKNYVFLTTIGALWGLLAGTRLLRGEEDAGRWQLVLSGSTRAGRATAATLAGLAGGVAIIFVGSTAATLVAASRPGVGFTVTGAVLYGLSLVIAPAVFVGVGAVTSQLCRTRRMATGLGLAVFGVAFVVRMVADSAARLAWVRWLTPFGWVERVAPFGDADPRPVLLAAVVVALLAGAAVWGAAHRDVGAGYLSSRDTSPLRPRGLGSALGLAIRLDLATLVAWWVGAAVTGLSLGLVAKVADRSVPDSMRSTLERFGGQGSWIEQYLGVAFLMVATVVALVPAGQLGAAAGEESSGRLVHLLASPVSRRSWLVGRLGLAAGGVVVAGLAAGVATWVGVASQGVSVSFTSLLGAGINVVPLALVVLGLGALVLAVAPRAAAPTVYAVVIGSLLVDLVASMVAGLRWAHRITLFHYLDQVPGSSLAPRSLAVTTLLGLALCAAAVVVFDRRDLELG